MTDLPYYNELALAIRVALFGAGHPLVRHMLRRNYRHVAQ